MSEPKTWHECLAISELPAVDEALRAFREDGTEDNAVGLVQAIIAAAQPHYCDRAGINCTTKGTCDAHGCAWPKSGQQADMVELPTIGAVPRSAANSDGILKLLHLVHSICIVDKMACWDHGAMFDLRDILAAAAEAPAAPVAWAVLWGVESKRVNSVHIERATADAVASEIKSVTEVRALGFIGAAPEAPAVQPVGHFLEDFGGTGCWHQCKEAMPGLTQPLYRAAFGAAAEAPAQPADIGLQVAARAVVSYRPSMSYNESYFGEPAGLFKTRVADLERALPPQEVKAAVPREADPLLLAIQRLNATPYSLTKSECIDVLDKLRAELGKA